ncbi:MAG: hypothetical protein K1X89_20630 [Myxococcaceae bacterium]|nr:hypothetical protein [Myxococcaceae bacterium]
MRRVLVVVAVVAAGCTTGDPCQDKGCGPTDAGNDAGNDAGPTDAGPHDAGGIDAGRSDAGQDAGPSDSGMDPADAGTDAGLPYVGLVSIHSLERNGQRIALASFSARQDGGYTGTCSGIAERTGACCFRPPGGLPPSPPAVSGGTVAFKVGATTVASLTPNMGMYFSYQWQAPAPPVAGDTVVASGAGDVVAPFSVQAVQPASFGSLLPAWDHTITLAIDRTKDFTVSWSPGPADHVVRLVMAGQGTGAGAPDRGVIECEVADSAGTITVASSLLAHFSAGDLCSICGLDRVGKATTSSANARVDLELVLNAGGGANFQ